MQNSLVLFAFIGGLLVSSLIASSDYGPFSNPTILLDDTHVLLFDEYRDGTQRLPSSRTDDPIRNKNLYVVFKPTKCLFFTKYPKVSVVLISMYECRGLLLFKVHIAGYSSLITISIPSIKIYKKWGKGWDAVVQEKFQIPRRLKDSIPELKYIVFNRTRLFHFILDKSPDALFRGIPDETPMSIMQLTDSLTAIFRKTQQTNASIIRIILDTYHNFCPHIIQPCSTHIFRTCFT